MLVCTYESDSLEQVPAGHREQDRLVRVDESSWTVESDQGHHRTYWRVKEES